MAARTVWAIDVGHSALRAVKARRLADRVQVLSLEVVEYRQSLVSPGVDRDVQIQQAVHTFVARNDLRGCDVAVVVPVPSALVRFIQLPPVDRSAIPDIVQYEARQQIPFPLGEVCWDHAAIDRGFIPGEEVEVGIFALRRGVAFALLNCLRVGGVDPAVLQIPPVALFNFINFERAPGRDAVLVMDMGVENTHLLCMSGDTLWIRSLPIAGNTFTQVVQEALGISYEEAEQEKRNARKSPRAKEIAEAIRQPMSRFIEEVQRSLGYFRSLHPETRVTSMLALGEGFKLPGLARYLQEAAGLEIHGLSSLENFDLSQARNLKHFKQHAASFAAALGMAAQALGISGALDTTLLPPEVLRERLLARKKPYVAAAAAVVLGLVVALFAVEKGENSRLRSEHETVFTPAKTEIGRIEERRRRYSTISSQAELRGLQEVDSIFEDRIVDRRGLWHQIFSELIKPIPREPANEHIWLTAVGSSYVGLRQAAASLVELPPELMAARPGGRRSDWMESRLRTGRVAEGPEGLLVMPEQVLSVVVMGEAKHPERAAFVDREFVSKLNESPVFSFAKMVYSELEVRWVDSAGRVVGVVVEGRPDTGVPMSGRAALEDLRKVEYTQFVVRVFVDLEGKLAAAVEEERKRLTEAARMGPQP